ncbi:MAG: apolipoprotein N-acyltransferase [Burkholderiaceae bacterium]|jgi:apolipoprotein N-acyltransferase|nr:apolipoprotein N-acyltransferase [Burkholderiaceae bacterium]
MRPIYWLASPFATLLAGVAQAVAIADPWNGQPHWWLQMASLGWLAWQLAHRARRHISWRASTWVKPENGAAWRYGLRTGWLFGLGWLTGTFWWLFISMHTYGGLAAPLAVAAVLALAGLLSICYALAAAVFMALAPAQLLARKPMLCALGFAALWTLAELLRGTLFTGFPWGAGGYAHVDGPLAFLARYAGVYGLGFAAAALAALLALTPRTAWRQPRMLAASALVLLLGAGLWGWRWYDLDGVIHLPPDSQLPLLTEVALLQGNIAQDEKFIPGNGVAAALDWYGEQLRVATAPLVVAPETALPLLPEQLPMNYWAVLTAHFSQSGQAALFGMPLGDMERGYTNSVIGLTPGQAEPYRYDKRHLVPFGEFIPPLFRWFVHMMNIPLGDFARGGVDQPSLAWRGQRLAPNVCYEDLFGEELAARFADPARAPTVFVNVSNIAWFGDTVAIDQHLQISRMRALEFERPMLRATNTGATAIIDHRGQVTHQLPRLTRAVLTGRFEGRTHITPYARWAAVAGLWPLVAWCVLLAGVMASRARRLMFGV